ncbi:hypothetical protein DKX38_010504 [Salix brachista]|uniref:Oleosin n=1 Tax=Salix brachista TaxID=2182728 RepID=A0A5N5MFX2_9ROSI|nr:hypothetical protein DKX38_010504 [Salix brachista]
MSDQSRPMSRHEPSSGQPTSRKAVKFMTAGTIGAALLVLSGLTLPGTVIAVVVATPVIVMFSPILVPAAIAGFSVISGIVFSSGRCLAAVMVMLWIYNYVSEKKGLFKANVASQRNIGKDANEEFRTKTC